MVARSDVIDMYSLSPMQEGMLFHYIMDETSDAYFEQMSYQVTGELDIATFERAFNRLIDRYDVLRTVFIYKSARKPRQVLLKKWQTKIYYEDISHLPGEKKSIYLQNYKHQDKKKGFDLARENLIRLSILKMGKENYEIIWSFHHIIMDGWCTAILIEDMLYMYDYLKKGLPINLPGTIPYKEYIKWLEQQDKEKGIDFWKNYLQGYKNQAFIPGKQKVESDGYNKADHVFTINEKLTQKLVRISKESTVTLNTIFQALWGVMLQKYNNTDDVVFGYVVSGRPTEIGGIETMVGLLINTVPVRVRSWGADTVLTLLERVQAQLLRAKKYEYIPLAEIQAVTSLKQYLLSHILIFENYPIVKRIKESGKANSSGFSVHSVEVFEQTNYDMDIMVIPEEALKIKISYNSLCFDVSHLKSLEEHLIRIVEQVTFNPGIKVSEVDLLSNPEKEYLLHVFNKTANVVYQEKMLYDWFEAQVEKTPDRLAVIFRDQEISYRHLNERANQLAAELRRRGVGPDRIVALMAERSLEMMTALLAILKAGGGYLPIDPIFPVKRIRYMLKDSDVDILLSQDKLLDNLGENGFRGQVIDIFNGSLYQGKKENPGKTNHSSHLAYLIYTSGSSGKPKGILVDHQNVIHFIKGTLGKINFASRSIILGLTTISFDIFVLEIFIPLTNGLNVVLADEFQRHDPGSIKELIVNKQINMLQVTPSRLKLLVEDTRELSWLKEIKTLIVGGELFPENLFHFLKDHFNGRIYNVYGPTEATVWCTMADLTDEENIHIGDPLVGSCAYVLDRNDKILPMGITGELCIGGRLVTRGYLNRTQQTCEQFVPNPITGEEMIYKTGDLCQWNHEGYLEILGRVDFQVKIRGYRIELGEIEQRLLSHPDIEDALVIDGKDQRGDRYLCAYIVSNTKFSSSELREFLDKDLPEYMIPSYFVKLEQIPLNSNGKVDRNALPKPDAAFDASDRYQAPRNPVEEILVKIWEEILEIFQPGILDNFFELGGHSLKATRLIARIYKELNVEVPLGEVFKRPTITGLFEYIKNSAENKYVSVKPMEKKDYFVLASAQKRFYVLQHKDQKSVVYNIPSIWILAGAVDQKKLADTFLKLIKRHETLRTSFERIQAGGEVFQRIHDSVAFDIEFFHLAEDQNQGIRLPARTTVKEIVADFIRAFDLSKAPLLRVGLIKEDTEKFVLMVDMHHIISDGVSHDILVKEFSLLYGGKELPGLKLQYKDYSRWQRKESLREFQTQQENFWLEAFPGEIPLLSLPTDHARPTIRTLEGDTLIYDIGKEETVALRKIALTERVTMFMLLFAIFNVLISKLSRQEDIVIGTPVAGRRHPDLEQLIGVFINTLALRNYPGGEKVFKEFLGEVKTRTLKAFENQDYPFEDLVRKVRTKGDASRNPIFDVMFVMQNTQDMSATSVGSLDLKPTRYRYENKTSKFDLTLTCTEYPGKIHFTLEYATPLFEEETIRRYITYYKDILSSIINNLEIKIKDIECSHDLSSLESNISQMEFDF